MSETEPNPFAVGALVRLRSGGPSMTVRVVAGDQAYCDWFDFTRRLQQGTFFVDSLEPAEPRKNA